MEPSSPSKISASAAADPDSSALLVPVFSAPAFNPLFIDHVIARVCDFMSDGNEVLNMRYVCRHWNQEATREFAKRSKLDLAGSLDFRSITTMLDLMTLLRNPNGNFPLPPTITFDSCEFVKEPRLLDFLKLVAPRLKSLEDRNCRLNVVDTKGQLGFPKLLKFGINLNGPFLTVAPNSKVLLVQSILTKSPVLEELRIYWIDPPENPDYEFPKRIEMKNRVSSVDKMVMAAEIDMIQNIPKTLKRLIISKAQSTKSAKLLAQINLPRLMDLKLDFRCSNAQFTSNEFFRIFDNFKNTLVELTVANYIHEMEFPVFSRLTTLTLAITRLRTTPGNKLQPFAYHFPNVKTLDIRHLENDSVIDALFPGTVTAPSLTNVKLPFQLKSYNVLMQLLRCFPNLKALHVAIPGMRERHTLSIIFDWMQGIEELDIHFERTRRPGSSLCLDAVFTGIYEATCREIKREPLWNVGLVGVKTLPGISDLKKLRILRIRGVNPSKLNITDITGYLGLMKLERLETLEIDNFQMSPAFLKNLKLKFGTIAHTQPFQDFLEEMNSLPKVVYMSEKSGWA